MVQNRVNTIHKETFVRNLVNQILQIAFFASNSLFTRTGYKITRSIQDQFKSTRYSWPGLTNQDPVGQEIVTHLDLNFPPKNLTVFLAPILGKTWHRPVDWQALGLLLVKNLEL